MKPIAHRGKAFSGPIEKANFFLFYIFWFVRQGDRCKMFEVGESGKLWCQFCSLKFPSRKHCHRPVELVA